MLRVFRAHLRAEKTCCVCGCQAHATCHVIRSFRHFGIVKNQWVGNDSVLTHFRDFGEIMSLRQ